MPKADEGLSRKSALTPTLSRQRERVTTGDNAHMTTLRIATRKSPLALWQTEHVAARLRAAHPGLVVELVPMSSRGDEVLDRSLAAGRQRDGGGNGEEPGKRRTHLCARLRGSLRLIPIDDVHYLQAEEKYVVVHHARGEDLIEESLKSLEAEFADRFVRIHRNCLVARSEIVELRRASDGHTQAVLRHDKHPLEVSRRCVAQLRDTLRHL